MKLLNFGAGTKVINHSDWDNADIEKHNGSNLIFDFNKFPYPIKDNTYDYVLASHVLEHLEYPEKAIHELFRITKHKGIVEVRVPHLNSEIAFAIGHINQWILRSFDMLCNPVGWETPRPYKLEMISSKLEPTYFAKFIPPFMRVFLSRFLRGILREIKVKIRVIKEKSI